MSEIQGLLKENVSENTITVKLAWARKYGLKGTKNGEIRKIPILDSVKPFLFEMINKSQSDFVFSLLGNQKPVDHKVIHKRLYKAMERIGISAEERKKRRITFHSFRHYRNTRLVASGAPLFVVQSLTGHKDLKMTAHYYHAQKEDLKHFLERSA